MRTHADSDLQPWFCFECYRLFVSFLFLMIFQNHVTPPQSTKWILGTGWARLKATKHQVRQPYFCPFLTVYLTLPVSTVSRVTNKVL